MTISSICLPHWTVLFASQMGPEPITADDLLEFNGRRHLHQPHALRLLPNHHPEVYQYQERAGRAKVRPASVVPHKYLSSF